MLADLLGLVLVAVLGGLGVWFSLAAKLHNDLTAQRERKQSFEFDRDRFEVVSGEVGLRLLRALNAGAALPPLTAILGKPPNPSDLAGEVPQFAATWVYETDSATPRARTTEFFAQTAVDAIETALYNSGGHHLLSDRAWLDKVLLGNPRTTGPQGVAPGSDNYVRASDVAPDERAAYSFAMFYCEECIVWVYRITGDDADEASR